MVARAYVPDRGDVVWLDFRPARGHEQQGRRPALVLSPKNYNQKAGLALVCPLTSNPKGYPFEVTIDAKGVSGAVLVDQVRCVDWKARKAQKIRKASAIAFHEVQEKLMLLLFGS